MNLCAFAFLFAEEKPRCPSGFGTEARKASPMQGDLSIKNSDRIHCLLFYRNGSCTFVFSAFYTIKKNILGATEFVVALFLAVYGGHDEKSECSR